MVARLPSVLAPPCIRPAPERARLSKLVDRRLIVTWLLVSLAAGCERAGDRSDPVVPPGNVSIPVHADKRGPQGYRPNPIVVKAGAAVTWTNHDSIWHTVTSDEENLFGSEPIPAGGTFTHGFPAPGRFPYHCAIPGHQMTGVVMVEP